MQDVDYGRLMGTLIKSVDALVAEERGVHNALLASLGAAKQYTGSATTARHARTGIKTLAGGADAGAGQVVISGPGSGAGPASPVDPGAGRLRSQVPRTVEEARGNAYRTRTSMIFNALAGAAGAGMAARSGRWSGAPGGGGQFGGWSSPGPGAGGPGFGGTAYVPGYGYYGGSGTPYGMGAGGGGQGGPGGHGGIPPSGGSGGGGHGGAGHSGLMGAVASRVPGVGLAVLGTEEMLSQRNKNAYYQGVEGGSNASGFTERAKEEAYRWTTMDMFSSSESRQAFKGVTRIGYNSKASGGGPSRQDALDFAYHGKSSYGATVDESLMTLQEASKSPLVNLKELSGALKQLSDDAGKAGVNAQMARSQMVSLMSAAIGSGYGSGSVSAAASVQGALSSYGKSYADTSGAGQLTPGFARYAASQAGMTYGQLTSLQKTNPAAAASIRTGVGMQGAAQVLTPEMQAFLTKRINDFGGRVDESVSVQIAADFLRKFGDRVDPQVVTAQLSALTGMQFSDFDHAIGWVVNQMAGNTEAAKAKNTAPSDYTGIGKVSPTQAFSQGMWSPMDTVFGGSAAKHVMSGGKVDPVMAALASQVSGSQQVIVHTASGPRAMPLTDAMAKHPNELASGQAKFTGLLSKYAGKTVADVLGSKIDTSRDWSAEAAASDASGISTAQDPLSQAWGMNSRAAAAAGNSQHVTVDLSSDARKLLTVLGSSGTAGAAGEAAPPVNPFALNPSANR